MEIKTQKKSNITHNVYIFDCSKIEISGAVEVMSSTEKEVVARLENKYMIISGSNLTISKLNPEEEFLVIGGNVAGLRYVNKIGRKSIISKVFK